MTTTTELNFGYCDYHKEPLNEKTYRWKGCWDCWHFSSGEGFHYVFVYGAATELGVKPSTVNRLITQGKMEGSFFVQGRDDGALPAPRIYHIFKSSLDELKRKRRGKT